MAKVSVVGTTSWGTTLAIILAQNGSDVFLWARTNTEAELLKRDGQNARFLAGHHFSSNLHVTASLAEAISGSSVVVVVVPSRKFQENIDAVVPFLTDPCIVLSATKGLERLSGKRMSEILSEKLPVSFHDKIAVLSGPNLSHEVVQGKPSSTVVASRDESVAKEIQGILGTPTFRVYTNSDITGVELGGALKNIIAIGSGITDGLGYGDNAKAAFITRGLAEITRLSVAAGAHPTTMAGLAGVGDLIATCASPLSRNRYVGERIATGNKLSDILSSMDNVAEGIYTIPAALELASRLDVDMPITSITNQILFENLDVSSAVSQLMGRAPGPE